MDGWYNTGTTSYHSGTRDLLLAAARQPEHASLFNYASMAHNNHFFFHGLVCLLITLIHRIKRTYMDDHTNIGVLKKSPTKTNMSQSLARDHLLHSFTNINTLRDEMILTANAMFGPGFVWLVKMTDPKYHNTPEYRILTTYLAGTPYPAAHYRTQSHDMSTMPRDALPITNSPLGTRLTTTDTSPGPSTRDGGNVNGPTPADLNRQTHYQNQYPGAVGNRSHAAKDRVSLVPLLCVNTWQHVWMWDYGIAGKYNYLQAWWERIDWGVVERKVNEGAKDQKFSNQQRY